VTAGGSRLPSKASEARLRRLAARLGYRLERVDKPREPAAQLVATLRHFGVDAVLDVGANTGQYARALRGAGYDGPILSFEPLPEVHAVLEAGARGDPSWRVAPPMALGAADGEVAIARSAESDMSSILPQNRLLRAISPSSAVRERITVTLRRLDSIPEIDPAWRRLFLKIDVQGYEPQVLAGVGSLWPRILGVQLEMALVPLYEGEREFRATIAAMEARGYDLHLLIPGYFERKLGRQLQVDGVFYRRDAAEERDG